MTRITWLGEDELDGPGIPGPSFTFWNGIKFRKGEPVEIDDPTMIRKARGNQFFEVQSDDVEIEAPKRRGRPPKVRDGNDN